MLEREFVFTSKHIDPTEQSQNNKISEASSYVQLQNILLTTIKNVETEKTIRLNDYTGDVETDVKRVLKEMTQNPFGAYAVSNIAYQQSKILTYYELSFTITYRRTKAQLAGINTSYNSEELKKDLKDMLMQFPEQLTFEIFDYSEEKYDFNEIYNNVYYSNPSIAYGQKSFSTSLYPEDGGTHRIVEITIAYTEPGINLRNKSIRVRDFIDEHIGSVLNMNDPARRLLNIHELVCESAQFDEVTAEITAQSEGKPPKDDPFTPYGAFINGSAVSEGYALAFKQLCDESNIHCIIIHGRLQGLPHVWNMVELDGKWYHIDASSNDTDDGIGYRFFACTNDDMIQTHSWDTTIYPEANGKTLRNYIPKDSPSASLSRLDSIIYNEDPTSTIDDDERTVSVEGTLPDENEPIQPSDGETSEQTEPNEGETEPHDETGSTETTPPDVSTAEASVQTASAET